MRIRIQHTLNLIAAFAMVLLASCGRDKSDLLQTVPGGARIVAAFNLDELLKSQKLTISSEGKAEGSEASVEALRKTFGPDFELITAVCPTLHTDACAAWNAGLETGFTGLVRDGKRLAELLTSKCGDASEADGFDAWQLTDETRFYTDGKQWWMITGPGDASTPADVLDDAKRESAADIKGVGKWLAEPGTARIVIRQSDLMNGWGRISVETTESRVTFATSVVDSDGEEIKFGKYLGKPYYGFLKLVPRECGIVTALAAGDDMDWEEVARLAGLAGGFQVYGMVEAAMPILKNIDGTVGLALDIPGLGQSMPDFGLYARMDRKDAEQAIATLRKYASRLMMSPRENGGEVSVSFYVAVQANFNF